MSIKNAVNLWLTRHTQGPRWSAYNSPGPRDLAGGRARRSIRTYSLSLYNKIQPRHRPVCLWFFEPCIQPGLWRRYPIYYGASPAQLQTPVVIRNGKVIND